MRNRRTPARVTALLLTVALVFGVLCGGAFAATIDTVQQYDTYVCLGDSIAAGFGDYAPTTYCFERVPEAYHSIVADAVGAELIPMAHVGTRTEELRWLLEDDFAGDDVCMAFNGMSYYDEWLSARESADEPNPGFSDAVYNALKDYYGPGALQQFYRDQVSKADLITLEVGENDVILYAALQTMAVLADETDSPYVAKMKELMGKQENYGMALDILFQTANTMHMMTTVLQTLPEKMAHGYQHFFQNWEPLINDLHALAPNATIVAVGLYNPFNESKLTEYSAVTIGKAAIAMILGVNAYMRQQAARLGYLYADVMGTDLLETPPITNSSYTTRILTACHPSEKGHAFMAQQIIKVLPEREETPEPSTEPVFPFTDVNASDWFYDDVYACWQSGLMQGKSAAIFDPAGVTTRAEFATVIYRLAGEPSVDGMTCPFKDLTDAWYRDAVVWCSNAGVVNGVTPDTFAPSSTITREQMVTMLYRFSGSPAASLSVLDAFADAASVSEYARPAMAWAVENGIIRGVGDNRIDPTGDCTRAALAAVLSRFEARSVMAA